MITRIQGLRYWKSNSIPDSRGEFKKVLMPEILKGLSTFRIEDFFITSSACGVIRGMHLQRGAAAGHRIVHLIQGEILDVVIDLRDDSPTFGKFHSQILGEDLDTLIVPPGVAHGFEALVDSKIIYLADREHVPELDTGVNPHSFGFKWKSHNPNISERDLSLPNFRDLRN